MLVRDVSLHYHVQVNSLTSTAVVLDFNSLFGRTIESFYARKDHIIEAMWASGVTDDSIDIHSIRLWLSIRDSTIKTLLRDRAASRGRRNEFTCEWFQRTLLDFSRGSKDVLAVTGPAGSGKSKLSAWIVERLQRPLGKKTYNTLSITIGTSALLARLSCKHLLTGS